MAITQEYKLIDGTFSTENADQILTALLNYKIDYHSREDFSNHIRFNRDIEHSKKRIQELTQTKKAVKELIANTQSDKFNLVINSTITVRLEEA
ncbi:hypothetical protein [Flavobacterium sp.]|uniref:hypothetical protein n=1 Tax=Flavobacterium sp. TaxID=239 RepID=UPI0025DD3774|nr:hypothetical protein [Flavobacterium sp.]